MSNLNYDSFNQKYFPANPIPRSTFNRLCSRHEIIGAFKFGATWFVNEAIFERDGLPVLLGDKPVVTDDCEPDEELRFLMDLDDKMRA